MATNEAPLPPGISVSDRLWSDEVGIANADSPLGTLDPTKEPGYEFSNGRTFNSGRGVYPDPAG